MSLGEDRVRMNFNPSANADVENLKRRIADFIDCCEDFKRARNPINAEEMRLWALAQTHAEDAAMWAVKAVTSGT
jgi:hypothetical protein